MLYKLLRFFSLIFFIVGVSAKNLFSAIKSKDFYADDEKTIAIKEVGSIRCLSVDPEFKYIQTCLNLNEPQNPISFYIKEMADGVDLFKEEIKDILVIGLGGGALPTAWQYRGKSFHVETVEMSEKMKQAAKKYFLFKETNKNKIIINDGADYLSKSEKIYQYIALDAYNNHLIPDVFRTKEFIKDLDDHLDNNGIFVVNYCHPERYNEMHSLLESFFDVVQDKSSGASKVVFYRKKS